MIYIFSLIMLTIFITSKPTISFLSLLKSSKNAKSWGHKKTPAQNDLLSRYGQSSEIVMFLFMAHQRLPEKMASILHTKLKHNDVASLKDLILEKGQDALEELERSHTSVNRMNHRPQQSRPQYNRGYKPRADLKIRDIWEKHITTTTTERSITSQAIRTQACHNKTPS